MLNKRQIENLIRDGAIQDAQDASIQIQPAGFDVSIASISSFTSPGRIDFDNKERKLADLKPLQKFDDDYWFLPQGSYFITFKELTTIPLNVVVLARPRSSLLRSGVTVDTGVWDPGYSGRAGSLMIVTNPHGLWLKDGARVIQLIFFPLEKTTTYKGIYQDERK